MNANLFFYFSLSRVLYQRPPGGGKEIDLGVVPPGLLFSASGTIFRLPGRFFDPVSIWRSPSVDPSMAEGRSFESMTIYTAKSLNL